MRLTVLGCSGSVPGPDAAASGYLVEAEGGRLAVDLGNGTLAALQGTGRDPFELDALLLSHLHPDHCADFAGLTVLRRYHPEPTRDPKKFPLPVYAPTEAPTRLGNLYAPDEAERLRMNLSDVYRFFVWNSEVIEVGGFSVTAAEVVHPCEAYGMRFERGGRTLCYTGDTGICDAITELATGVDVLLAEASWTHDHNRPPELHLSGREAGELAAQAGVGRLLLTHVPPWTDPQAVLAEAKEFYPGEVELVKAGRTYDI